VKLKEDNDDNIDEHAVLRARILIVYYGFDRHEDQWQWGLLIKTKAKHIFQFHVTGDQVFLLTRCATRYVKAPWLVH
jgi:hypothetical protein